MSHYLIHGRIERHTPHPDLIQFRLTCRVTHKLHLIGRICDRVKSRRAPRVELASQKLVSQLFFFAVAFTEDADGVLLVDTVFRETEESLV